MRALGLCGKAILRNMRALGFVPQNISEGQSNRLFQSAMDRLRPSGLPGAEEGPEALQGVPGLWAHEPVQAMSCSRYSC